MKSSIIFFIIVGLFFFSGPLNLNFSDIFVFWLLASILNSIFKKTLKKWKSDREKEKEMRELRKRRTSLSKSQLSLLKSVLQSTIDKYGEVKITPEISLEAKDNQFTNFDDLTVSYYEETICSVDELGLKYVDYYNKLLEFVIVKYTQTTQAQQKPSEVAPTPSSTSKVEYFINSLSASSQLIKDVKVNQDLSKTIEHLKQIQFLQKHYPDCEDKLKKLFSYYLPILVEILASYATLEKSMTHMQELESTRERLLKTISLIQQAMKTISASIYEEDLDNMSADISTLEAILRKDGLIEDGSIHSFKEEGK